LYGLIDAGFTYVRGGANTWQVKSGTVNGSRWGLRGSEDLGGGVNPIYNTVSAQADYALSKRTDVYLQGNLQHVSRNSGH
ncbi:hypothetical protein AB4Y33_43440, partial [Paraburkholderia sp. BR14319]